MAITFDDMVAMTAELPKVGVGTNYGTPAIQVKGKAFARMWSEREYTRDGVTGTEVVVLWGTIEDKAVILDAFDAAFETPHYEGYGNFLVRLADVDPDDLREFLEDSYRSRAPKTALKELDGRTS